jgi:hypothetical protein
MKKLHFLFTNGAKFSLEIPEGTNILDRVNALAIFAKQNNEHVESHKELYSSKSRVKFPTSRGFFVGYEGTEGQVQTLITPDSSALIFRGKALTSELLANEIEYRVNQLSGERLYIGCRTGYTPLMAAKLEADKVKSEEAKERKAQKLLAAANS